MISIDSIEKFIGARIKLTGYGGISIAFIGYGYSHQTFLPQPSSHNHHGTITAIRPTPHEKLDQQLIEFSFYNDSP